MVILQPKIHREISLQHRDAWRRSLHVFDSQVCYWKSSSTEHYWGLTNVNQCPIYSTAAFGWAVFLLPVGHWHCHFCLGYIIPKFLFRIISIEEQGLLPIYNNRDDVGDHEKWSKRMRCERILHSGDVRSYTYTVLSL